MTPTDKLTALSILSRKLFPTKEERGLHEAVIASLMNDLTPKELLPLTVTEVYRDAPHIITTHGTIAEAMTRIDKVRGNEKIYAVHVTRGEEVEYTWESQ